MGPQIPLASIVTKVWILAVYNNAAECSFARVVCPILGKTQSWQKTVMSDHVNHLAPCNPIPMPQMTINTLLQCISYIISDHMRDKPHPLTLSFRRNANLSEPKPHLPQTLSSLLSHSYHTLALLSARAPSPLPFPRESHHDIITMKKKTLLLCFIHGFKVRSNTVLTNPSDP